MKIVQKNPVLIEKLHVVNIEKQNYVLRYIDEIFGNLTKYNRTILEIKLKSSSINSPLVQLKQSNTLIEIYTEFYRVQPLVIQGTGAGTAVTTRGIFGNILKLINIK